MSAVALFLIGLIIQLASLAAFGLGLLPGCRGVTNPFISDRPYALIGAGIGILIMLGAVLK